VRVHLRVAQRTYLRYTWLAFEFQNSITGRDRSFQPHDDDSTYIYEMSRLEKFDIR
jgi:hypothetical protein